MNLLSDTRNSSRLDIMKIASEILRLVFRVSKIPIEIDNGEILMGGYPILVYKYLEVQITSHPACDVVATSHFGLI